MQCSLAQGANLADPGAGRLGRVAEEIEHAGRSAQLKASLLRLVRKINNLSRTSTELLGQSMAAQAGPIEKVMDGSTGMTP